MVTAMNCPHCHQPITTPKARKPRLVESTDTARMTDAQLFAYYKRTAPLADLRFWLANAQMSESLRAGFVALESAAQNLTIPRPAFYRQLTALQALWRKESNAREHAKHFVDVPTVFESEVA